ncbi:MAG: hypothetical protein J0H14_26675 [Alphaproteobacteria bacterium]|nr:hypothetical protein [Alphaproteobacteria bacterium]
MRVTMITVAAALALIGAQAAGLALIPAAHADAVQCYEAGAAVQRMSTPRQARPYAAGEQTGVDNGAFRRAAAEQTGVDNGSYRQAAGEQTGVDNGA